MIRSVIALLLVVSGACATTPAAPPAPISVMFNEADVAWAKGTGTGSVEGQAFLKTRGGDVKYGAGETVMLIPASTYTSAWAARFIDPKDRTPALDERAMALSKTMRAGGDGRFRFTDLPAGEYIVLTSVTWQVPGASRYEGMSTQGGYLSERVRVEAGKTATVIVTR